MPLTLASLIASGLVSAGSALAASRRNKAAKDEEDKAYGRRRLELNADLYRSPLDNIGNRALLKGLDQRLEDTNDAIANRAAAGGATAENVLAAKQTANRTLSDTYAALLRGEDVRQQGVRDQQSALDERHSQSVAESARSDARNWQQWGAATAGALSQFGMASYLSGNGMPDLLRRQAATDAFMTGADSPIKGLAYKGSIIT